MRVYKSGPDHPNWKGDAAGSDAKRLRLKKQYLADGALCRICAGDAQVFYFEDGDPNNTAPRNVWFLCYPCYQEHGFEGRDKARRGAKKREGSK